LYPEFGYPNFSEDGASAGLVSRAPSVFLMVILQFRMGTPCALSTDVRGAMRTPCATQFRRHSISGSSALAFPRMGMNFRIHRARVVASRAALQDDGDGDGDGTEGSSWNILPLATEENLQRMVS